MTDPDTTSLRPRPVPDRLSEPFWEGIARGQLVLQRCGNCRTFVHPPFPECTACHCQDLEFEAVSGKGTIFERAIVESPVVVGFIDDVPYACLLVELDEQTGLLVAGNLVDADPHEAVIGRPVEVVFRGDADGFVLPQFVLTGKSSE